MKVKLEAVPKFPGIYRVLTLDNETGNYREPSRGSKFAACLDVQTAGEKRKRIKRYFSTFAEAKEFRQKSYQIKDVVRETLKKPKNQLRFKELAENWAAHVLPHLERSTQARYRSYLKHFAILNEIEVEKIDPSTIDEWIAYVKRPEYLATLNVTRCGFDHEFTVLRGILNYYSSRFNRNYRPPFLRDHNKMLKVKEAQSIKKDLSVEEFKKFINALRDLLMGSHHEVIYYVALMQYAIYGRIQDAAALFYEDFDFNRGKIYVRR